MSKFVLLEASPWRISDGAVQAVRLAGGGRLAYTQRGFSDWRAGVTTIPMFSAALGYNEKGWSGGAVPNTTTIQFFPVDAALVTDLLTSYLWPGAPIEVRTGDDELAPGVYVLEITGTVASVTQQDGIVQIGVNDLGRKLDRPVVAATFAGTGGIEGIAEATGRPKRRTFGLVRNVEGFVLDKANNIYEFGDPAFPLNSFVAVKDMGRAALPSPTSVSWAGSIAATLTALQASVPAEGSCVVAPSIACVKWWTQPVGPLTADIQGEVGAGYVDKIADIAQRLVSAAGATAIAGADVTAINAVRAYSAGVHVGDDNETFAAVLDRLLMPCNVAWSLKTDGSIGLSEVQWGTSAETFDAIDVERVETFKPVRKLSLGYQKNHRTHTDAEISAALLIADILDVDEIVTGLGRTLLNDDTFLPTEWTLTNATRKVGDATATFKKALRPRIAEALLGLGSAVTILANVRVPVVVGRMYWEGVRVAQSIGSSGTATVAITGQFYDAAGSAVGSGFNVTIARSALPTDGSYVDTFLGPMIAPATAVELSFRTSIASNGATGAIRFDYPQLMDTETGADQTTWIEGKAEEYFKFDTAGVTAETGELPRDLTFKLKNVNGAILAGVTWAYTVISGTVNGFTSASGAQSMSGSGVGTLTVASPSGLGSATAVVIVTALFNAIPRSFTISLYKQLADTPVSGGGGGGGGTPTTIASKTSGFTSIASSSFADITGWLDGTTTAGVTTATINVTLDARPVSAGGVGDWNVELKVERNVAGTPTQKGSTQGASSSAYLDGEGILMRSNASFSFSISDTGLTASTAYQWRVSGRLTSGTRSHAVTGTVSVVG